jgi:uncharacterized membrane protein YfcA
MHDLLAMLSGALVGFSLWLIGGGGSILATPLLLYVVGVPQPHVAIGTGALAVAANAFAGFVGHAWSGTVRWRSAALFAVVGMAGAAAGSSLGKAVDGQHLLLLFALLMIVVGVRMLRSPGPRVGTEAGNPAASDAPSSLAVIKIAVVALLVGTLAGFFGIGGGFLIVPGLVFATGMPMINAIGSSLLAVGGFGLATAATYAVSGLVAWDLAGEFIAGGILGGLLGMRLALRLASHRMALNVIFAVLIFVVAAYMLYRSALALGIA